MELTILQPADAAIVETWQALNETRGTRAWRRFKVPGTNVSLLTATSKMPCLSWSLPAGKACPGAVYGDNAICGACYARKGMYAMYSVPAAQEARFAWTRAMMRSGAGRDAFVAYMTAAVRAGSRGGFFRVHDSGDLFSAAYAECWRRICHNVSDVKFWFPTRSYRVAAILPAIQELAALDNVTVRPSALHFDADAPVIDGLQAGSTASVAGFNCPASQQNNECRDCRACWTDRDVAISYHKH